MMSVHTCQREQIPEIIEDLARLRIAVFREWPYLYDCSDGDYERAYLARYLQCESAAVIVARDDGVVVGASTCLGLADESAEILTPFEAAGLDVRHFFYFGESVLLPAWRGHGLGVAFFAAREQVARSAGAAFAVFCAVRREEAHPARPADARSLQGFWGRRGFTALQGLTCRMSWKEPGTLEDVPHDMDFWIKPLRGQPVPEFLDRKASA